VRSTAKTLPGPTTRRPSPSPLDYSGRGISRPVDPVDGHAPQRRRRSPRAGGLTSDVGVSRRAKVLASTHLDQQPGSSDHEHLGLRPLIAQLTNPPRASSRSVSAHLRRSATAATCGGTPPGAG
jgi:hypothetical protein